MGSSQSSSGEAELQRQPKMDDKEPEKTRQTEEDEDDEPDEWDKRIFSTGCSDENMKMTDCYFEKKDWRACTEEVAAFRECWKRQGNEERTSSKDA